MKGDLPEVHSKLLAKKKKKTSGRGKKDQLKVMLKIILLVETESCLGALLCWTEKLGLAGPAGTL